MASKINAVGVAWFAVIAASTTQSYGKDKPASEVLHHVNAALSTVEIVRFDPQTRTAFYIPLRLQVTSPDGAPGATVRRTGASVMVSGILSSAVDDGEIYGAKKALERQIGGSVNLVAQRIRSAFVWTFAEQKLIDSSGVVSGSPKGIPFQADLETRPTSLRAVTELSWPETVSLTGTTVRVHWRRAVDRLSRTASQDARLTDGRLREFVQECAREGIVVYSDVAPKDRELIDEIVAGKLRELALDPEPEMSHASDAGQQRPNRSDKFGYQVHYKVRADTDVSSWNESLALGSTAEVMRTRTIATELRIKP